MPQILKALAAVPNALLSVLYDFRLAKDRIEFVVLKVVPVATIPFKNIQSVEKQGNPFSPFTAYRFVNRIGPRYVIHKRRAWFSKHVVLSPANGDLFERTLQAAGVVVKEKR